MYLICRLLLRVRYELGPKLRGQNDVLVACFTADKAWDIVIKWLETLHIIATLIP